MWEKLYLAAGFEDGRGPRATERRQLLESKKDKKMNSCLEPLERNAALWAPRFCPRETHCRLLASRINSEVTDLCCFKLPSSWQFVTAEAGRKEISGVRDVNQKVSEPQALSQGLAVRPPYWRRWRQRAFLSRRAAWSALFVGHLSVSVWRCTDSRGDLNYFTWATGKT